MARLTPFSYHLPLTPLHGRDPRLKLAALMLLSLTAVAGGTAGLVLSVTMLAAAMRYAGFALLQSLVRLRFLWLMALFITLSHSLSAAAGTLSFSPDGLLRGAGFALRLLTVAALGNLFIATTSRDRVLDTLTWACTPLPPRLRWQLPLAVAVALSSYPLFARTMLRVREACQVRGAQPRRNPRLTLTVVARAALDDVPRRIAHTADAMTVRGFSETATPPLFRPGRGDLHLALLLLCGAALVVALSIWLA
ncbi:MAG: hypothetical protein EA404_14935 [Spirochaetaceae bacterium]|nr:MAG: hypothetical protein EA404_14935 [Spirochaetaceae bacterium]